jgi:S-methylmethionine-dependent homocysteine/selenocysteine methylase
MPADLSASPIAALMTAPRPWLADAGLETTIVFHEGLELPCFAAFILLDQPEGRAALTRWFDQFAELASGAGTGFVLDATTWRANMGWAGALGLDAAGIAAANTRAVAFARALAEGYRARGVPVAVNGLVGPSGDGYAIEQQLEPEAAEALHAPQLRALATAGADMVSAMTMTHSGEAIGVARAARAAGLPHVISVTLEVDGRLPSGEGLHAALADIEEGTDGSPLFYMINCAHPEHFAHVLSGPMTARIGGLRANASRLSHAELDACETLDEGDPAEFGRLCATVGQVLPALRVIGGCCGTDHRHVGATCSHLHGVVQQ